jgi:hypothetical protein
MSQSSSDAEGFDWVANSSPGRLNAARPDDRETIRRWLWERYGEYAWHSQNPVLPRDYDDEFAAAAEQLAALLLSRDSDR